MSAPADGGDAEKKKKKGGKLPRFLGGLALWAGGLLADRLVNKIINGHNARRLEAKNQKVGETGRNSHSTVVRCALLA